MAIFACVSLAKAAGKVRKFTSSEIDKQAKASSFYKQTILWMSCLYGNMQKRTSSSSASNQYTLEAERCGQLREFCQCEKQHMSVYKACCIREPIGFKLKVPEDSVRLRRGNRSQGAEKPKKKLAYVTPAGLHQNIIDTNLDPKVVRFE